MNQLIFYKIKNYKTLGGVQYQNLDISYQVFGKALHTAPIVIVNHALTGNSDVSSPKKGWWKEIVGDQKVIDTNKYTVICFNILGNGYDGNLVQNYKDFTTKDIALIFNQVLVALEIKNVFAVIGGSIGGGIAWEMAVLKPQFFKYLIPIAADWKATDWIIGHNTVQENILLHSKQPLEDARKMAMLFYRTPQSFTKKFKREKMDKSQTFKVTSWLNHHGKKLKSRFELKSYLMMNHLLTTLDITKAYGSFKEAVQPLQSTIIQIAINSDLYFSKTENMQTKKVLDQLNIKNQYHEINSIDGHDAFLIEHTQLSHFLTPLFTNKHGTKIK